MFIVRNKVSFGEWLSKELEILYWSQADLARATGLSRAAISKLVSGESAPTPETLNSIAKALKKPPEDIFREAGLLPPKPEDVPGLRELVHRYLLAGKTERQQLLEYVRYLTRGQEPAKSDEED